MRRNTAQTMMGDAKIESYHREKIVYTYPDSVFFVIEFNESELVKGFYWKGKKEADVVKTLEKNGFMKKDSVYTALNFPGYFKREEHADPVFRFVGSALPQEAEKKKAIPVAEETPKGKPFYGFTILGMKVWEAKPQ